MSTGILLMGMSLYCKTCKMGGWWVETMRRYFGSQSSTGSLCVLMPRVVLGIHRKGTTVVDLSDSRLGRKWTECIDKEWLREVEQKGKEVGNLLEGYVLF